MTLEQQAIAIKEVAVRAGCSMSMDAAREIAHHLFAPHLPLPPRTRFVYDPQEEDTAARAWLEG